MKHILFGGDGFVGRHLAKKLLADGEEVIIADIVNDNRAFLSRCNDRQMRCDQAGHGRQRANRRR
jgi:dTDP-glucose 4,6-dehydratase